MSIRKHLGKKVTCIKDCFKIFIERPSNVNARAQTWSNYKHHNTAKYFIAVTPQVSISFISRGWGGDLLFCSRYLLTRHVQLDLPWHMRWA